MNRALVILILLVASCSVSHVDKYPGTSVAQFPVEMQGNYKLYIGGFRGLIAGKQLDSVQIRILSDRTETLEKNGWTSGFIIDSVNVLSRIDNYFFLSKRDLAEPLFWNSSLIWISGKDLYLSSINATDKNLNNDKLKNYLQLNLQLRKNGQTSVTKVNAKDKATLKVLSTITTDSPDSALYYTMNDSMLLRFIKREIVGTKDALRFQRINPNNTVK